MKIGPKDQHSICFCFQISKLFGGLSICSLEAVVGRDGKEYLIEVNDSATTLMGESQEEDRKNIAELVLKEMEVSHYIHYQNYLNSTLKNMMQMDIIQITNIL